MIRTVLFDYGGVVSPNGGRGGFQDPLAQALGIPRTELHVEDLQEQIRKGLIAPEAYLAELKVRYPNARPVTQDIFLEGGGLHIRNELVVSLAVALRSHHIKTALLSNVSEIAADWIRSHGGYDGFEPLILSYQEHLWKPELAFYERAVSRLHVLPAEIIYVDDQEQFLVPARKLGMHTVLATSPEHTVQAVSEIIEHENHIKL